MGEKLREHRQTNRFLSILVYALFAIILLLIWKAGRLERDIKSKDFTLSEYKSELNSIDIKMYELQQEKKVLFLKIDSLEEAGTNLKSIHRNKISQYLSKSREEKNQAVKSVTGNITVLNNMVCLDSNGVDSVNMIAINLETCKTEVVNLELQNITKSEIIKKDSAEKQMVADKFNIADKTAITKSNEAKQEKTKKEVWRTVAYVAVIAEIATLIALIAK